MGTGKSIGVVLLVLLGVAACGEDEPAPLVVEASEHEETLDKQALWRPLLPVGELRDHRTETVTADGKTVICVEVPLRPPGEDARRDHLDGVHLSRHATKHEVRRYVAQVLRAAHRARRIYSTRDPEIELLECVGGKHVDVLLEPLVHLDSVNAGSYLIEAMKELADESHKDLILESLADVPRLIAVVVAKGWTESAAPTLLRALEKRSRHLHPDWVTAAARVARPQHYDHLKFQLAEGQDPAGVWLAIRDLPGMEPLDEFVDTTWRGATEEEYHYRWYELAVVAAHYGHVNALEPLARRLPETRRWWGLFQSLTGFGQGRTDPWRYADAQSWVATHKDDLVFDRVEQRYHLKQD